MAEKKESTKASRLFSSLTHQSIEVGVSIAAGLYLGSIWWALPIWLVIYTLWCSAFPKRLCWWCGGSKTRTDGRGNIRDKHCRRCNNEGKVYRVGARLMGRDSTA